MTLVSPTPAQSRAIFAVLDESRSTHGTRHRIGGHEPLCAGLSKRYMI